MKGTTSAVYRFCCDNQSSLFYGSKINYRKFTLPGNDCDEPWSRSGLAMYIKNMRKFLTPIATDNFATAAFLLAFAFFFFFRFYVSLMLHNFFTNTHRKLLKVSSLDWEVHEIHFSTHFKEFSVLHTISRLCKFLCFIWKWFGGASFLLTFFIWKRCFKEFRH